MFALFLSFLLSAAAPSTPAGVGKYHYSISGQRDVETDVASDIRVEKDNVKSAVYSGISVP